MDQPAALEVPHLRHLEQAKMFAIDLGGSLAKIAYFSNVPVKKPLYADNKIISSSSGRLHFAKFEARQVESCLNFIREQGPPTKIRATGGGSHRQKELIQKALGPQCKIYNEDEMKCIVTGANFLLRNIPHEVFSYEKHNNFRFKAIDPNVFPYLLVNIGSGVSIIKVESETSFERIGGSALGGASFWGLGSVLTGTRDFDELLELAEQGDHRSVDTLVGDIYGTDYVGLSADTIACSFGKLSRIPPTNGNTDNNNIRTNANPADLARSLLLMISNDIGQLASLYALSHNLNRVYFGGYFLRSRPLSMHTISYAVNFWSKAKVEPLFLRHEGYLGAIGAFLAGENSSMASDKVSWAENYACSSLSGGPGAPPSHLEMDLFDFPMVSCPLLRNAETYCADSVDLTKDTAAREYWLNCFEKAINKFVEVAVESQKDKTDAADRGQAVREKYLEKIKYLRRNPCVYGSLTVRSLLDMREQCLLEFDFADPYMVQKKNENELALRQLGQRINELDRIADDTERQIQIVTGLLAGNVFDHGAKEVVRLMEEAKSTKENFGFDKANALLQKRPWLVDNLDEWLNRLKNHVHQCAAIFVDNCGADFVLGVVPFARELIRRGSRVLLCANTRPVLNDVTIDELRLLAVQISDICPIWAQAVKEGRIKFLDSGQSSPCLDLSRIKRQTADELQHCDLLVIEGMGRAIHTNLNTDFKCDSIKSAVIKNEWLAKRLGGEMFSIVFKFQQAPTTTNI